MDWQEVSGNWVFIPQHPIGIVHFLGGAFVATAPHVTYRLLLEGLAAKGYAIIATPFVNTFDHAAIAQSVHQSFDRTLERLHAKTIIRRRYLPIYGVGHSMGCKLHLLIGSLFPVERAGNILISFNNFSARDAVPFVEQFSSAFTVEFTPSPLETMALVQERYQVRRNLIVKFTNDNLDQSLALAETLEKRFPGMIAAQTLSGSHITPLGQDVKWQASSVYTPFDAIGQWMKQEVQRDLNQLKREILRWLNPLSPN
ncbi:MAG: DUF1350 family protein [Aphanothece sp. CMT-3BRIN-NPC111]|jgi:hypothetical protein|nr:DUF1350 family protein [Aphanothece sp. CMT-3BRIN-NPC111]